MSSNSFNVAVVDVESDTGKEVFQRFLTERYHAPATIESNKHEASQTQHSHAPDNTLLNIFGAGETRSTVTGRGFEVARVKFHDEATIDAWIKNIVTKRDDGHEMPCRLVLVGSALKLEPVITSLSSGDVTFEFVVLVTPLGINGPADEDFARLEDKLLDLGPQKWCIVRHGVFMDILLDHADEVRERKTIHLPMHGHAALLASSDFCDAIVSIIRNPEANAHQIHKLTGPKPRSLHSIAKNLTKAIQHSVRALEWGIEDEKKLLKSKGRKEEYIEELIKIFNAINSSELYCVTPDLEKILGHHPAKLVEWAKINVGPFIMKNPVETYHIELDSEQEISDEEEDLMLFQELLEE